MKQIVKQMLKLRVVRCHTDKLDIDKMLCARGFEVFDVFQLQIFT